MDKKEGQGSRVGLHWETLGVGAFAMVPENARGGDRGGEGRGVYINVLHQGAPT